MDSEVDAFVEQTFTTLDHVSGQPHFQLFLPGRIGFQLVQVVAQGVGSLLNGYRGRFQVVWKSVRQGDVPLDLLPKRQERRE
jgi:hypothetical protein